MCVIVIFSLLFLILIKKDDSETIWEWVIKTKHIWKNKIYAKMPQLTLLETLLLPLSRPILLTYGLKLCINCFCLVHLIDFHFEAGQKKGKNVKPCRFRSPIRIFRSMNNWKKNSRKIDIYQQGKKLAQTTFQTFMFSVSYLCWVFPLLSMFFCLLYFVFNFSFGQKKKFIIEYFFSLFFNMIRCRVAISIINGNKS